MPPEMPRKPRQDRPFAQQHEEWMAHLRPQGVSRRTVVRGAVGAAAGSLLLGSGRWSGQAVAAVLAETGTVAGGFVVNGRHLSFGDDPTREMWVGGQLFNINTYNAVPPRSVRVWVDYGTDRFYGRTVEAELRELLTHVPVWDAKHQTASGEVLQPFTFTAFADEGIPGPSLDRDPSLLPESDWGMWNNGSYDSGDPDRPARTHVNTTSAVIREITKVRNLTNGTPSRFNLQAGDLGYARARGDIQPIINPDGPNGSQPASGNTPAPPANSGGWDYYDPWIWSSWFPMIEPSASTIPWMFATGNHEPEMFSAQVAADAVTVANYEPLGYGGGGDGRALPQAGPAAPPHGS